MKKKVMSMLTCEKRARLTDPGDPKECNLYPYHELLTDPSRLPEIVEGCTHATWGCGDCKKLLVESMTAFLEPIRDRRKAFDAKPDLVREILEKGNATARQRACRNLEAFRKKLNLNF